MSKRSHIVYLLFARLPEFTLISSAFTLSIIGTYKTLDHALYPSFFIALYAVMLIFKEGLGGRLSCLLAQTLSAAAAAAIVLYIDIPLGVRSLLLTYTAILLVNSLRARTDDPGGPIVPLAIGAQALLTFAFSMLSISQSRFGLMRMDTARVYASISNGFYIFLFSLALCLICRYMCIYYSGLSLLTRSRRFGLQSANSNCRVIRRSLSLIYAYMSIPILLFVIICANAHAIPKFWSIPVANRVEPMRTPPPGGYEVHEFNNAELDDEPRFGIEGAMTRKFTDEKDSADEHFEDNNTLITIIGGGVILLVVIIFILRYKKLPVQNLEGGDFYEDTDYGNYISARDQRKSFKSQPSTNQAVRSIFIKKVNNYRVMGLKPRTFDTADLLTSRMSELNTSENTKLLDDLYNLARYSSQTISKSDLSKLKASEKNAKSKK